MCMTYPVSRQRRHLWSHDDCAASFAGAKVAVIHGFDLCGWQGERSLGHRVELEGEVERSALQVEEPVNANHRGYRGILRR